MAFDLEFLFGVFRVGSDPFNQNDAPLITHLHYEAVMIAFDVEDDAVIGKNVDGAVSISDVLRRPLGGFPRFGQPALHCG